MNGMTPRSSFGGYPDLNGFVQPQYYGNGMKPQIYTVSGVLPSERCCAFCRPANLENAPPRRHIRASLSTRWKSTE
jgi:hypothetical protein